MTKEQKFYDTLKGIFVGAKVEGESGYINLMRIKSRYYEKGVFPKLQENIDEALKPFPEFREELFDKLYTFFNRYFSESGSIYFRYTPIYQNIYEKVYTDDKDVILFWKTHMLYYVKTDRMFKNLEVQIGGFKFFFDVSTLEYKKANEKREIIYKFKGKRKDGIVVFNVYYSERGKKTKIDEILKSLKKNQVEITEDILENVFGVFEKQNEVDYFINKNAKEFLKEQFNLWIYQYLFSGESKFTAKRIKQLQALRDIAFKIISFISQFEDELVRIWNKPKFVLNSNYVITLDKIAHKNIGVIKKILKDRSFRKQVEEWKELGIVDGGFDKGKVLENNNRLNKKYQYLPIDTKYFKNLEVEILSLFDNLDNILDGWLIKSENYQALNTILPKFSDKVRTIYIDPPYNTGSDEFIYKDKFQHSSWLTMMENKLNLGKELLRDNGVIFINIGNNAYYYSETYKLGLLLENIFPKRFADLIWKRRGGTGSYVISDITEIHEYILCFGKENSCVFKNILGSKKLEKYTFEDKKGPFKWNDLVIHQYTKKQRPNLYYGIVYNFVKKELSFEKSEKDFNLRKETVIYPSKDGKSVFVMTKQSMKEVYERGIIQVIKEREEYKIKIKKYLYDNDGLIVGDVLKSIILENDLPFTIGGTAEATKELKNLFGYIVDFETAKPVNLIKLFVYLTTKPKENKNIVLDFFAGSGTTAHAVMKLNKEDGGKRKFILVEMADYFETIIIPRIKKVAYSFDWENGKPQNNNGIGIFFKYYEFEQYEDTLRKVKYEDSDLFENPYEDPYNQYIFMRDLKLLEALEIDYEKNKVKVDLSKLYQKIDIPETLSNLLGRWIKKLTPDFVEFENAEKIDAKDLDYNLIKPLIWW